MEVVGTPFIPVDANTGIGDDTGYHIRQSNVRMSILIVANCCVNSALHLFWSYSLLFNHKVLKHLNCLF